VKPDALNNRDDERERIRLKNCLTPGRNSGRGKFGVKIPGSGSEEGRGAAKVVYHSNEGEKEGLVEGRMGLLRVVDSSGPEEASYETRFGQMY